MTLYEFQFVEADGGRPGFDFSHCDSDDDAARQALVQLGLHGSCRGVEVYEGERLVARLQNPHLEGLRPNDLTVRR